MGGINFSQNFLGGRTLKSAASCATEQAIRILPILFFAGMYHKKHEETF